ncbi:MAG: PDZ domain-containing protein [Planctomycetota bacterium]|nr:PDZ domain-containing protein [Planctomycetota bacterium]
MLHWLEKIVAGTAILIALEVFLFCFIGTGSGLTKEEGKNLSQQIQVATGRGRDDLLRKLQAEGWETSMIEARRAASRRGAASARKGAQGKPGGKEGKAGGKGKAGSGVAGGKGSVGPRDGKSGDSSFDLVEAQGNWEYRSFPADYKNALLPDIRAGIDLLSQASSKMVELEDGSNAYQITGIQQNSIISDAGFRAGDTLISVNGNRVSSEAEARALWPILQNETRLTVEILRDGSVVTLFYDMKK